MLTGYISGGTGTSGTILKTVNGGGSWIELPGTGANWLFGVYFTDLMTGWAGGINGALIRTTDGGATWVTQASGTANRIVALSFANSNTGWAVGYAGTIINTTNGGANWNLQVSNTTEKLWSVDFINETTGWAAGWVGVIVHTTNGGITAINPITNEIPSEYNLDQNYPNPFNPMTNVKFQMPNSAFVGLRIYDILGRLVATLVNEYLKAGFYNVSWNASNYPSGVYYYKLTAGNYTETKKMILIK
jgi:photosystem II stability/assembly factor-like uncharacterized protein